MFFYKKGVFFYRKRHVFIKFKDFWVNNHTDFITPNGCLDACFGL